MRSAHWVPGDRCLCGATLIGSLSTVRGAAWVEVICLKSRDFSREGQRINLTQTHTSDFIATALSSKEALEILINSTKKVRLTAALADVMRMIETGQLVRNTTADNEPNWALRNIEFVMKLKNAQEMLD